MTWKIDPAHSEINFTVRHMMISNVRGQFRNFNGTVEFDLDHPENSSVEVQIETDSITTGEPNRDNHLRSPDFFNAREYPIITFKGRRIEVLNDKRGRVTGDLTIRELTRPVTLDVDYAGLARSPWGTVSAGFSASARINRKDWSLNWNQALETGGVLVGDEIRITIELEIVQQAEPELEPALAG